MHVMGIPEVQGLGKYIPKVQGYEKIQMDRKGRSRILKEHNSNLRG